MNVLDWFGRRRGPLDYAARYLRRQRVRIIDSSDILRKCGIDFVGMDGDTLVFVVVRTRGGTPTSAPVAESMMSDAALGWLAEHEEHGNRDARIDVLRLDWYGARQFSPIIRYFSHAVALENYSISRSSF